MANRLTGDFDAVLQISTLGMDRLLASIHRKGHRSQGSPGPHLLHGGFVNLPTAGEAASALRGHLQFQVSSPRVRVPNDTDGSRITVAVDTYAWFQKALGSAQAPEFVHGELNLTTGVSQVHCGDETLLEVDLGEAQVNFVPTPGSGADAADVARVRDIAEDIVRNGVQPVQLRISGLGEGEFAVRQLAVRSLSGGRSAVAVLLRLSDGGPPPDPAGVTQIFLAAQDELGVALGREFVTETLRDKALDDLTGVSASGSRFGLSFSAIVDPSTLAIALEQGRVRIEIQGSGSATFAGKFGFRITQRLSLGVRRNAPSFQLVGDPEVERTSGGVISGALFALFRGKMRSAIRSALQDALRDVGRELGDLVDDNISAFLEQLSLAARFDLDRIEVSTEAIVLAGDVDIGDAPPVVASFTSQITRPTGAPPTLQRFRTELDALASWIPGGTIDRYFWTETRGDGTVKRQVDEPHRFVLQVPRAEVIATTTSSFFAWPPYTWCLEVFGTQHLANSSAPLPVSSKTCGVTSFVPSVDLARDLRLTVRVPDGEGGTLADLDPWAGHRPHIFAEDSECRGFLLIHHAANGGAAEAAKALRAVQEAAPELSVFPTLLVTEKDERCSTRDFAGLATSADAEGTWRARFDLTERDTTVLLGAAGRELFRDSGPIEPEVLVKRLREHCHADRHSRPPRVRPVGPTRLEPGVFAPELFFPCGPELEAPKIALRKLDGREARVCFWTVWSEASIEQLRRLAEGHDARPEHPTLILVNDGDPRAAAAKVLEGLDFDSSFHGSVHAVFDETREISRRYGIAAWPTVISVDRKGRIAGVQQGLEPRFDRSEEQESP